MRLHLVRHGASDQDAALPPGTAVPVEAPPSSPSVADRPSAPAVGRRPDAEPRRRRAPADVIAVRRISTSSLALSAAELAERVGHPASLPRLTPLQSGQAAVARHDVHIERVWPMRSPSTGALGESSSASSQSDRRGAPPARLVPVEGLRMNQAFPHEPVMAAEVIELLAAVPTGLVLDATLGAPATPGALLEAHPGITLLGIDRDPIAVAAATGELAVFGAGPSSGGRGSTRSASRARGAGRARDPRRPAGPHRRAVRSRRQLAPARRGRAGLLLPAGRARSTCAWTRRSAGRQPTWSTRPTRTRWSSCSPTTARPASPGASPGPSSPPGPITTTGQLADVVRAAIPAATRRTGGHPARRVFQAIRIAVNEELDQLHTGLDAALGLLRPGGRCVVISYHSGEDRLVKATFTSAATDDCQLPARPALRVRGRSPVPTGPSRLAPALRRGDRPQPPGRGRPAPGRSSACPPPTPASTAVRWPDGARHRRQRPDGPRPPPSRRPSTRRPPLRIFEPEPRRSSRRRQLSRRGHMWLAVAAGGGQSAGGGDR